MDEASLANIRAHLMARRRRIAHVLDDAADAPRLVGLLKEVDSALEKIGNGTYGACKTCHEAIEDDLLERDPLAGFCLDHLDTAQQRALEYDLETAARIQGALLPPRDIDTELWRLHYYYEPAGPVSGDYCDVVPPKKEGGALLFAVGDVSGKGVAASMLMAHMHAVFHTLASFDPPLDQLVAETNRLMCESTTSAHFATLVCGKARANGEIEVCNAGHLPPLLVRRGEIVRLDATNLPIGILCDAAYALKKVTLEKGDQLVIYTDGLSEAESGDQMYGDERVLELVSKNGGASPRDIVRACVRDLDAFTAGAARQDDVSIMAIQRVK